VRAAARRACARARRWRAPPRRQADQLRMMFPRIVNAQFPRLARASDTARDLLSRLLVANPKLRLSVGEVMSHPWFLRDLPKARPRPYGRSCAALGPLRQAAALRLRL